MSDNNTTRDFHHPFEPYDIQKRFMNAVYDCLEDGKVGIFESPTGTGKSLSLICGSLTWLRDHKRRTLEDGFQVDLTNNDDPSWMLEHARNQRKQEAFRRRQELNERLAKIKAKEKRAKERAQVPTQAYKRHKIGSDDANDEDAEAQFALDDYESDRESEGKATGSRFDSSGLSAETQALMDKLGYTVSTIKTAETEAPDETKIFFCSRTHSQLTQFSSELSRVKLPPAITMDEAVDDDPSKLTEDVKHLTLGSRKNLCINPKVSRLGNATTINERCLELQQSGSTETKCSFLPTKDNEVLLNEFRDHALAKIRDIEDLGVLGKKLGVCPYYASRPAIKFCEIITLPYPLLLQRSAREALGLSLKNHIVIIDEAHNLMDAIAGIYSVSVTLSQVQRARSQLTAYLQKFRNRLKGKNRVYVAQIIRILDSIIVYLQSISMASKADDGLVDMVSIMSGKGVDQINIFKLNVYLQESKLARKVDGYTAYTDEVSREPSISRRHEESVKMPQANVPVLMQVQSFLLSLMNPSAEGRFFYSKEDQGELTLRYMLLDPTYHFKDIVEDARAVVLAGGTMSPMSDYERHLLPYLQSEKIQILSCGHVIPPSNLLAAPITKASNGAEFDFTFEGRNKDTTINNLGQAILSAARRVADGLVVFFPSYAYLDTCIAAWKNSSAQHPKATLWDDFTRTKPVFLEQRSGHRSTDQVLESKEAAVDSVLTAYSAAVASGNGRGALLFAVIGGTLSEGINFSDALGRGVIVVGLPFPNPHSAEWKAKLQYITSKENARGGDGKAAARDFYENACMRAVNQCVGRAIRHKGDYAAIMMLDKRYGAERIQSKLPKWIRGSLTAALDIRDMEEALHKFFAVERRQVAEIAPHAQLLVTFFCTSNFIGPRSIRVLELQPAVDSADPIHCELKPLSLNDFPQWHANYTALSYTWDGQTPSKEINCGGGSLFITPNCDVAIRQLRSPTEIKILWIDSICIDQTPDAVSERNVQVALMGDIYKSAARVVVWLGPGDERIERALRQVMDIALVTKSAPQSLANRRLIQGRLYEYVRTMSAGVRSMSDDPIGPLFECSWFYRMWTVQKVTLSAIQKTFLRCGAMEIPWPCLVIAVDALKAVDYKWGRWAEATKLQKQLTMYVVMRRIPGSKAILDDNRGNLHNDPLVFDILTGTRKKLAGDEKDKVIALYGLFKEMEIPFPAPDYSLPVEVIYRQATIASIRHDKGLFILYQAPSDKRRKSLASWVPDWADQGFDPKDGRHAILLDRFAASGAGRPLYRFSDNEKVLVLRGKIVDTVIYKTESLPNSASMALRVRAGVPPMEMRDTYMQHHHHTTSVLRSWVEVSKWTQYPTGEQSKDVLRRTLVQDNPEDDRKYNSDGNFDAWYDNMSLSEVELAAKGLASVGLDSQQSLDPNMELQTSFNLFAQNPFHTFTTVICSQKCFFYTEKTYFGTAPDPLPDSMQAGDVIVLISGLGMPLLLRRVEGGYRLISHIYVHGLMYGESWPEDDELSDIRLV
ncbi:hypothetical protein OPT61_g794 [Boeremia exigua]|uniref:Uncharacterized protein n=1 Tax=Boeremia exigua TaxID=749465 RepID=A0ACC2ISK3_9PLEO|nr:hypothetical protein OPT61_g794 [Boeremia exigua]